MLRENYFQTRILPIYKLSIKYGIELTHFQIYKAVKILPLMHIFSGSIGECASPKWGERGQENMRSRKKRDGTQKRIPRKIIKKSAKIGARGQRSPEKILCMG